MCDRHTHRQKKKKEEKDRERERQRERERDRPFGDWGGDGALLKELPLGILG